MFNELFHWFYMLARQRDYINRLLADFNGSEREKEILESANNQLIYFEKKYKQLKTDVSNFFKI